jgi:hypothetical protein
MTLRRESIPFLSLLPFLEQNTGASASGNTSDDSNTNANSSGDTGGNESSNESSDDGDDGDSKASTATPFAVFPTKDDFDKRLNREGRRYADTIAQDAGFKNHREMIDHLKQSKESDDKQQSEADRKAQDADKKARDAEAALELANQRLIKSEVIRLCNADDIRIRDADAAYRLMNHDDVEVDEDGEVYGVEDALKALLKDRPYLHVASDKPDNAVPANPKRASTEAQENNRFVDRYIGGRYRRSKAKGA